MKFIQPVSMIFNYDDFVKDNLKQQLIDLRYEFKCLEENNANSNILVTNFDNRHNIVTNVSDRNKLNCDRYYIDKYNPQLFLAIAAMTEGEDWIIGEHLVYIHENDVIFKVKELKYADWELGRAANSVKNRTLYRKATIEELINRFTMKKEDKEIIGYKLIKPEYEEAAVKIVQVEASNKQATNFKQLNGNACDSNIDFKENSLCYKLLKKANVLDLWFAPVYSNEFKVNDYVLYNGYVYKIIKIVGNKLYYFNDEHLINNDSVTIPTKEQIEERLYTPFMLNETAYVEVIGKTVYHNTSNITLFVLELGECYTNIKQKFATYDAILDIDSVEFTKTGCVCKTKLSTWLEIYKFITQNKKEI
jgi:hypothetical protein